jgi:hypothetical protein
LQLRFGLRLVGLAGRVVSCGESGLFGHQSADFGQALPGIFGECGLVCPEVVPGDQLTGCARYELVLGSKLARQIDRRDGIGHLPAAGIHVGDHAPGQAVTGLQRRQHSGLVIRQLRQAKIHHARNVGLIKPGVVAVKGDAVSVSRYGG